MRLVLNAIEVERERQSSLKAAGKFVFTCADTGVSDAAKLTVLAEEFGEVSREVCELLLSDMRLYPDDEPHVVEDAKARTRMRLRKKIYTELVQVAAVSVAWCEALAKEMAEASGEYSVSRCTHGPDSKVRDILGHECGKIFVENDKRHVCELPCGHDGYEAFCKGRVVP